MKNNYFPIQIITILFFSLVSNISFAQHYMEITDGPLAGTKMETGISNYMVFCDMPIGIEHYAEFCNPLAGANLNNPTGPADVNISDGCVGVCTRGGGIAFDLKSGNIFTSGGKAMVIINNDQANPDLEMLFGTDSPDPSFWGISLSFNNGEKIFESGVTSFKFKILAVEDNDIDDVIWDDGQFSGGIGSWSTVGISCGGVGQNANQAVWEYSEDGNAYGGGAWFGTIGSPTACNGAMVFNSYLYDTNGGSAGDGPCWSTQIGELISPDIDLSTLPAGSPVTLTFYQSVSHLNSEYFVAWSNDGGITWQQKEINEELGMEEFIAGEKKRVRLDGAIPSSNFKVKFIYKGNYKFWIIDDVKLVKAETFLVVTDPNWMTSAPYPTVPLSQMESLNFMTNVENISDKALTGTVLKVKVLDNYGVEVYYVEAPVTSTGQTSGMLLKGDKIENIILGNYKPFNTGAYRVLYSVESNENNENYPIQTVEKTFTVSALLTGDWGREDGITGNISMEFDEGERVNWAYSNIFKPSNEAAAYLAGMTCFVANGMEMGQIGASAQFYLYASEDLNHDNIFTSDEYEIVGYGNYDFQTFDEDDLYIGTSLSDINTGESVYVPIDPTKTYILSLVYEAPLTSPSSKIYWSKGDKINQRATEYLSKVNGEYTPTHEIHSPWTMDGPIDCSEGRLMFEGTPVPAARMFLLSISSTKDLLDESTFKIYPTNTKDFVTIEYMLDNSKDIILEIFDVNGKLMSNHNLLHPHDRTFVQDVRQFSQGTYFVKITTPQGSVTKPFNVIK